MDPNVGGGHGDMLFAMMGIEFDIGGMGGMGMGMPGPMDGGPGGDMGMDPFGGQSFGDFRNEVLFKETSADNFFDDFGPMGGMGMGGMDPFGGGMGMDPMGGMGMGGVGPGGRGGLGDIGKAADVGERGGGGVGGGVIDKDRMGRGEGG